MFEPLLWQQLGQVLVFFPLPLPPPPDEFAFAFAFGLVLAPADRTSEVEEGGLRLQLVEAMTVRSESKSISAHIADARASNAATCFSVGLGTDWYCFWFWTLSSSLIVDRTLTIHPYLTKVYG